MAVLAVCGVERRFEVLRQAPTISHEGVAGKKDLVRCVVRPLLGKALLACVADTGKVAPKWVLNRVVPREVALLLRPDIESAVIGVTLFVNEQRLGPVIAGVMNAEALAQYAPFVRWAGDMARAERGRMVVCGETSYDGPVRESVLERGPVPEESVPAFEEGEHFLELSVDNRNGAAFASVVSLHRTVSPDYLPYDPVELTRNLLTVARFHLTAALVSAHTLQIQVRFHCRHGAPEEAIAALAYFTEFARGQISGVLHRAYGLTLNGSTSREGTLITWNLQLSGIETLVRALLGAEA